MNLIDILDYATDKTRFTSLDGFTSFCENYLEYIDKNLQATIISQNENHYRFFQYDNWGSYQITRPVNSNLFYSIADFDKKKKLFSQSLKDAKSVTIKDSEARDAINKVVYTIQ